MIGRIKIDGETYEVEQVVTGGYLPMLVCGKTEFYIAESVEAAGEAARTYWRDMAKQDRREFACIIGEERLVKWALGESDEFGISSLDDFLDRVADVPEEQWAGYDGCARDIDRVGRVAEELGWDADLRADWVAFRHN
jgi:hypothetical protein